MCRKASGAFSLDTCGSSSDCYGSMGFRFLYSCPQCLRFLEEGKLEEAEIQKQRIEQLQRERRRVLQENSMEHQPRFFRCVPRPCGWTDTRDTQCFWCEESGQGAPPHRRAFLAFSWLQRGDTSLCVRATCLGHLALGCPFLRPSQLQ